MAMLNSNNESVPFQAAKSDRVSAGVMETKYCISGTPVHLSVPLNIIDFERLHQERLWANPFVP